MKSDNSVSAGNFGGFMSSVNILPQDVANFYEANINLSAKLQTAVAHGKSIAITPLAQQELKKQGVSEDPYFWLKNVLAEAGVSHNMVEIRVPPCHSCVPEEVD